MTTRISASPVGHARHAFGRPRRATRAAAAAHPRWRATTVASAREEFSSSSRSPSRRTALVSTLAERRSPRATWRARAPRSRGAARGHEGAHAGF